MLLPKQSPPVRRSGCRPPATLRAARIWTCAGQVLDLPAAVAAGCQTQRSGEVWQVPCEPCDRSPITDHRSPITGDTHES
jgi:hypothetical protein